MLLSHMRVLSKAKSQALSASHIPALKKTYISIIQSGFISIPIRIQSLSQCTAYDQEVSFTG